jgi:hypothetical protein
MSDKTNQKTITYIIGGTVGLITGLAAAYLLIKNQDASSENKSIINSKDGLKIGVGLASLLKQIADLSKV